MAELANVSGLFTDANLKLYYKFSETGGTSVTDSSGNSNTGTASNASILNNIGGPFGNKATFVAASSNNVTITDAASLKPTGNFSVVCWVRTTSTSDGVFFASYSQNSNPAGIRFQLVGASGKLYSIIGDNAGNAPDALGNTAMNDGKWHHCAVTWDGSNFRIYLDGLLDKTQANSTAPAYAGTNYVRVGSRSLSGTDGLFFDGDLDDLALFNGTVLSQAQINALYIKGQAPALANTGIFSDTNLKLYYKLDDAGGTTVTDSSAGGNNGTASAASINANDSYGMVNSRGLFDGTASNKITITDATSLKPTGNFTAGFWMRTTTATGYIFQSQSENTNVAGWYIRMSAHKLDFLIGKNTGTTNNTDYKIITSTSSLDDGKWHHIACVYDGTNMAIWVDGVSETSANPGFSAAYAATNYVRVGCDNETGTDVTFYTGDLDELFLLNGTALNSQQINQLYNGLQGNVLSSVTDIATDTNLKLYYKLDETGGTTVTDSSGAGNTGTASNSSILNNAYGKFNNKGVFVSASSNDITIVDASSLKPTGNFSAGGWFKTTTTGVNQILMASYSANPTAAGFFINIDDVSNHMYFRVADNASHSISQTNTATITDGRWHLAVAVWDGSNAHMYIDGVDSSGAFGFSPAYASPNFVFVGANTASGTPSNFFNGDMDDLFLLNGTALTLGQVQELYRLGGVAGVPLNVDVTSSFVPGVKIIG